MQELKEKIKEDNNILNLYVYGSRVYGTNNINSDWDFIMVVDKKEDFSKYESFGDITSYTQEEFIQKINEHEISVLECLFLDEQFILKEKINFEFNLDLEKLREAISAKSSNSWVKCKKKLTIEEDYNEVIGKKSAWHSLRIIDFGTQIAKEGKINNYQESNKFLPKIFECNSWLEINDNFKKIYNEKSSNFKLYAPKKIKNSLNF